MKTFIFTYSESTPRNGTTEKSVVLYRVIQNRPERIGSKTDTYTSAFQLVWELLKELKALPASAFALHHNNSPIYGNAWAMREAGFADIHQL